MIGSIDPVCADGEVKIPHIYESIVMVSRRFIGHLRLYEPALFHIQRQRLFPRAFVQSDE
jgi:hypothetical protein